MAWNKFLQEALAAAKEEEEKRNQGVSAPATMNKEEARPLVKQASASIKAGLTGAKAGAQSAALAPASSLQAVKKDLLAKVAAGGTGTTGAKATTGNPSPTLAGPVNRNMASMLDADRLYGDTVKKLLADYQTYAGYGPQQKQEIVDSLLTGGITNPGKGNVGKLNYTAMANTELMNEELMQKLSALGMFDDPFYALNSEYIAMPTLPYLTRTLEEKQAALAEWQKKYQDAQNRQITHGVGGVDGAYSKFYDALQKSGALETGNYTPMQLLYIDSIVNGTKARPMSVFRSLPEEQQTAELERMLKVAQGADWDSILNPAPIEFDAAEYNRQTSSLQSQIDMLTGETQRRQELFDMRQELRSNPNFAQASQYQAPEYEMNPMYKEGGLKTLVAGLQGEKDVWGDKQNFINNWQKYQSTMAGVNPYEGTNASWIFELMQNLGNFLGMDGQDQAMSAKVNSYINEGLHLMLPHEVEEYNAAMEISPEMGERYLELTRADRLRRNANVEEDYWRTRGENLPTAIVDTLASFPKNVWGTANTVLGAVTGENDPNAAIYGPSRQVSTTRQAAGELAGEMFPVQIFGEEAGTVAYNVFTSIGDMLVAKKIGNIAGAATNKAEAAQKVMGFVMATESGANTYLSDLQEGKDPLYAAFHGIANGSIEAWSESGFIDSLFDEKGRFLTRVWKSGTSEGLEEVVSEGGQMGVDLFLSYLTGQENDIQETYKYYEAQLGKDKAALATLQHYGNNFALAYTSGALTGAGTSAVVNTGVEIANRQTGKAIQQQGDPEAMLEIGKAMPKDSEAYAIAVDIEGTVGKGKKMPLGKLGRLTQAIGKNLSEEYKGTVDRVMEDAITERLVELGTDSSNARKNAPVIRKLTQGEKLTVAERAAVAWDDNADQVTREISREMNAASQGDTQRTGNKWVTDMRMRQVEATGTNVGLQTRYRDAMERPVTQAAKAAAKAGEAKVNRGRSGKPTGKANAAKVYFDDGTSKGEGDILRFEKAEDGLKMVVQTGKTDKETATVSLDAMTSADGAGTAGLISYLEDTGKHTHDISAEEANTMLAAYNASGGDVGRFIDDYTTAYLEGYSGLEGSESGMGKEIVNVARTNGQREAEQDERLRKQRASAYKAVANPVAAWLGTVDSNAQVKGQGDVDGLGEALEDLTESQRVTAEAAIEFGKAVGLNVVLFESNPENVEGIQNGSFDAITHTVYLDVNSGTGSAQDIQAQKNAGTLGYAMGRTLSHELTHYLEAAAPEAYAKYSQAVKAALKAKGQDFAMLMREKMDTAIQEGRKLTMAGAAAEVIADASEYMLQDSKFTNNLDTTVKGKIKAFIQNFAQKLKDIFRNLTGGHKESAALREMKDGVYHYMEGLQDLWDAGFDEILAKVTEDIYAVEVRDDGLMATHNLTEDKLRKALSLGSFPMPSIAIQKATNNSNSVYGDYAVVFGRETIDPDVSEDNKVYVTDAYTAPFPQEYVESNPDASVNEIVEVMKKVPESGIAKYKTFKDIKDNQGELKGWRYFEAKPNRVVGFDEIKMVVAPDTIPADLAAALDEHGIPYTTYDGSETDRMEKLNAIEGVRFSDRDDYLLDGSEYARFSRNWESRKTNHFTKRTNGGVLIDMGNLLVYTDRKGNPQHVLEVMTEDLWEDNDIVQRAILLETGGYDKDEQQEILGRIFPEGSFRFRVPGDRSSNRGQNGRGSKRNVGKVRREDREEQSSAGATPEVQVKRYSTRDLPTDVSIREFLESAGDDAASTVEEKNALQIYRKRLDAYKAATQKVEEAEAAWSTAVAEKGSDSTEAAAAQNVVNIRRSQQRKAYNELVKIEETPHVKQVFDWTRQFITEALSGSAEEIAQRQAQAEATLAELESQYEALKAAGRTQMAAEAKRTLELQQRYARNIKSQVAEGIKERREEFDQREARARKYRHTRDEVDKLRKGIGRKVKRLNALRVRETDQKHVPQELQHVVDEVMRTFTDGSLSRLAFSAKKTANLRRTYAIMEKMESAETYFVDDETQEKLDNLVKLSEKYTAMREKEEGLPNYFSLEGVELQREILTQVDEIVSHVQKLVDDANKAFLEGRTETFTQYANATGEKLLAHADRKTWKGVAGKMQEMLDETLVKGNTTPVYFFEHLDNPEIMDVFNEIREGQSYYAQIVAEGKDFVQAAKKRHNYGKWVADGKLTMKTSQGHTIELTREEAAEIYAIAKREKANKLYQTEHLLYGGFQYKHRDQHVSEDKKTLVKDMPHQLDMADIAKISNWLTAEQKAYADELVGFLSTTMADYGNEASMDMYGYKKFTESYYIPFHTVANQRFQKGDEGPQGESAGTGRVKNSGFTHKVQYKANQPLYVGGLTETVADHIHRMAAYSAMVQPIENMKRLLNHKVLESDGTVNTIRALIGQKYGKASEDYMTQLLKDLNGATQSDQRAAAITDKLVGAFKRGAVMASASVVLQQPTAMARAMAMISPKYFAQNPFYRPSKGTWEEMMKHSGTAVIKDMGKFDVGMGLTASQYILDENLSVMEAYQRLKGESKTKAGKAAYDRFMAWLTAAPGAADQWTWGLIWKAVKAEQADLHPDMDQTSDAFLNLVGERFDDVVDHTQVYDSVLSRSNLMRSTNALHKMATSFMSEPTLSLNMLYDALTGIKSKRHTGWHRGRIIGSVVASQVLAGALAALVQAWNDDDDKRSALEKYADRATGNILDNLNPLGMIPYVSDIVSLFEGYDVERPDMSVIADVYSYGKTFFASFEDGGTPTWKQIENFAGTLANLTGVPAKNISREIRRTWNAVVNTDWSAPSAFSVGQAVKENLPWYSDKKTEYYQRIVMALVRGEAELAEDYKTFMLASKAVDADKMTQGIRDAYKDTYQKGGIDKEQAIDFLLDNDLVTGETEDERKKSAFQYVDKWGEGTTNYSAYNTLKDAYGAIDYTAISKAWKELTNYGYTDEQVKEESRKLLRKLVEAGTITPSQATQILRKWCSYKKDSDNVRKPQEWLKDKK